MNNLTKASSSISAALEKMSTGLKINRAKDDAANYCIATKLNVQLRDFNTVSNNVQTGMSLINTAEGALGNMTNILTRLRDLSLQGANETYSTDERQALQNEADQLTSELARIKSSTKFNGIELFVKREAQNIVETKSIAQLDAQYGAGNWENIDSVEKLKQIKTGADSVGKVYVLTSDIDLNNEEWQAIGTMSSKFQGTFDGNGHTISNLKISSTKDHQGFFGYVSGATIKNVEIENADIKGGLYTGILAGRIENSIISNSITKGILETAGGYAGGLIGFVQTNSSVLNSCSTADVKCGASNSGGLIGYLTGHSSVENSYAIGNISGANSIGGLVGNSNKSTVIDSYATGNVVGERSVGGLVGTIQDSTSISNSYATGGVNSDKQVGGLVGYAYYNVNISNSYATGEVKGNEKVGGLLGYGYINVKISNSYVKNIIQGNKETGGLIGYASGVSILNSISASSITKISGNNASFGSLFGAGILTANSKGNYSLGQNFDFAGTNQKTFTTEETQEFFEDSKNWKILGDEFNYSTTPPTLAKEKALQLCVGSNGANDMLTLDIGFDLGGLKLDFSTRESSVNSIKKVDNLINILTSKQANLGAVANRLDSTLDITNNNTINWNSAISTIQDTDVALESMNLVSAQILQQVSTSLFTSARQNKTIALSLIQQAVG